MWFPAGMFNKPFRAGLLLLASIVVAPAAGSPPNILYCLADDWSWPHAGVYGDQVVHTPTGPVLVSSLGHPIPLASIVSVTHVDHQLGFLQGLGLGMLIGGTGGAILGASGGDDPPCGPESFCILRFSAGEKAVFAGVAFGGLGALIGGIVGALRGDRDEWESTPSAASTFRTVTSSIRPIGPPGSIAGLTATF